MKTRCGNVVAFALLLAQALASASTLASDFAAWDAMRALLWIDKSCDELKAMNREHDARVSGLMGTHSAVSQLAARSRDPAVEKERQRLEAAMTTEVANVPKMQYLQGLLNGKSCLQEEDPADEDASNDDGCGNGVQPMYLQAPELSCSALAQSISLLERRDQSVVKGIRESIECEYRAATKGALSSVDEKEWSARNASDIEMDLDRYIASEALFAAGVFDGRRCR